MATSERVDTMATVDGEHSAGHKRAGAGGKKQQGRIEFFEFSEAPHGDSPQHLFSGLCGEEVSIEGRGKVTWGERVDANVVACPLGRQTSGHVHEARFSTGVSDKLAADALAGDGGDIDDAAMHR